MIDFIVEIWIVEKLRPEMPKYRAYLFYNLLFW